MTIGKHIDDLGTRRLSWRDLRVVVTQAPPQGALRRSIDPEGWGWDVNSYLLAANVDLAQIANWQRQGKKNAPKPSPILRPGQSKKKKRGKSLTAAAQNAKAVTGG